MYLLIGETKLTMNLDEAGARLSSQTGFDNQLCEELEGYCYCKCGRRVIVIASVGAGLLLLQVCAQPYILVVFMTVTSN